LADVKGTLDISEKESILAALHALPDQVQDILKQEAYIAEIGHRLSKHDNCFVIGRTLDEPLAREGALKLKEISYIHAEAQAGGELKHGSITLVEEGFPVIAIVTQPGVRDKMISNIEEVKARGAHIVCIGPEDDEPLKELAQDYLPIPKSHDFFGPILATIYLQLLGYYAGVKKGIDVDKPKNLAKSVTVE
jgi:glucosamine--fructose-6-phosphate aminotransferase (isomerizing)